MPPVFIPRVIISLSEDTDDLVDNVRNTLCYQDFKDFMVFIQSHEIDNLKESLISNLTLSLEGNDDFELPGQKGGVFQYIVFMVTTNVDDFMKKFHKIKEACDIEHTRARVFYFLINGTDKQIDLQKKEHVDTLVLSKKLSNAKTLTAEKHKEKLFNLLVSIISLDIPVARLKQVLFSSGQNLSCNVFSVTEPPHEVLEQLSLSLKSQLFKRLTSIDEKPSISFEAFVRVGFFKGSKEFLNRAIALRLFQFRAKRRSIFKKWKSEVNTSIDVNKQKYFNLINPQIESIRQWKLSIKKNLSDKAKQVFFSSYSVSKLVSFLEDLKAKIGGEEHIFKWFFFRLHLDRIKTLFFPWSVVGAGIAVIIITLFLFIGIKIKFIYPSVAAGLLVGFIGYSIFIRFKAKKLKLTAENMNERLLSSIEINTNNYFRAVYIADLELLKDVLTNKLLYFKPILSLYNTHLEAINKQIEEAQEIETINNYKSMEELFHAYIDKHFDTYFKEFTEQYGVFLWNSIKKPSDIESIFLEYLFKSNFLKALMEFIQNQLPQYDKFRQFRDEYNIPHNRKIFCYPKVSLHKQLIIYPSIENQPGDFNECNFERTYLESHWFYIYTGEIL